VTLVAVAEPVEFWALPVKHLLQIKQSQLEQVEQAQAQPAMLVQLVITQSSDH
jgi:hypothetical protein